jgi:hypothetical protein
MGSNQVAGKMAFKEMYPWVTMIRPTHMFGAKVKFFTVMANFRAPRYPFIPLVDGGHCLTQPSSLRSWHKQSLVFMISLRLLGLTFRLLWPVRLQLRGVGILCHGSYASKDAVGKSRSVST